VTFWAIFVVVPLAIICFFSQLYALGVGLLLTAGLMAILDRGP